MSGYERRQRTAEPIATLSPEGQGGATELDPWGNAAAAELIPKVEATNAPGKPAGGPQPDWATDGEALDAARPPAITGATPEQAKVVEEALAGARCMVSDGMSVIAGGPTSADAEALMDTHFHAHDVGTASVVTAKLAVTAAGLAGVVPIDVHGFQPPPLPGSEGVILGGVPIVPVLGAGDIHLFPQFFNASADIRAQAVFHEASHKYAGTADHAYVDTKAYKTLSVEDALDNADSYTGFCAGEHRDEENREERERDAQREVDRQLDRGLAAAHAVEIWDRYERMDFLLWEDDHPLPDGRVISAQAATNALVDYFERQKPRCLAEVYAAYEGGQEEGPFFCSDGTTVRWDLYDAVIGRR